VILASGPSSCDWRRAGHLISELILGDVEQAGVKTHFTQEELDESLADWEQRGRLE
jgi:hypothetical protein